MKPKILYLGAPLGELSTAYKTRVEFFDRQAKEIYPDCQVLVKGQIVRLDTALKDGDKVELIMFTMAGV